MKNNAENSDTHKGAGLRPEAFEFEVKFKPYSKNQCSPIELSKIQLQAMTEKQFV
ncbi:hypothetical protein ACIQAA_14590 [Neobacillus sp. NPDC093182]|uniref:hypothetical protein n=1 Tax=Neobacillus sp. NPDC093182 TaxID=3364297 RepID=UPI0038186BB4